MKAVQVFDGDGTQVRPNCQWPIILNAQLFRDEGMITMQGKTYHYVVERDKGYKLPNDKITIDRRERDQTWKDIGTFYSGGLSDTRFTEPRNYDDAYGNTRSYIAFKNLRRGDVAILILEYCNHT